MKVEITLSSELKSWSTIELTRKEIQKIFQFLVRELKNTDVMKLALEKAGVESVNSVSLHFCGDGEMRSLQKQFRRLDRTTDVLSFSALEIAGIERLYQTLPKEERSWGDLVVSMETVRRGALRGRRRPKIELTEVLIHGFLHLLGMDHVQKKGIGPKEALKMKKLQKDLLKKYQSFSSSQ